MNINATAIAIKKLNSITVNQSERPNKSNFSAVLTLNAELMTQGYILSEPLYEAISTLNSADFTELYYSIILAIRQIKGSDVNYRPMYPNFPQQNIEADLSLLIYNALRHYWSSGQWLPQYYNLPRELAFETIQYNEIKLANEEQFKQIFTTLANANESLSEEDKSIVQWFLTTYAINDLTLPKEIPFAENKCCITAILLQKGEDIKPYVKTATDILRIATFLSNGDISLARNTRFKSFSRKVRKQLVATLETVINEEDIRRHRNKWIKLFHSLHVGDYSNKVYAIAKKARNNQPLESFNQSIELLLALLTENNEHLNPLLNLLKNRPSEFARRIDHVLRKSQDAKSESLIVSSFLAVIDHVPSRILLQLLGHLKTRDKTVMSKVVCPKGNLQKSIIIKKPTLALGLKSRTDLSQGIKAGLIKRFSKEQPMGKVWISPELLDCPIPTQQRSASNGLFNVARGTKMPIGENNTLRFFIYWVGQDIDLSTTFHNDHYEVIEHISYTHLRSDKYKAYHSGDITHAPKGACEFIDISIADALKTGARYLTMNVLVFTGPTFEAHKTCYAGWMSRSQPNSNEIFDPKTVEQKIDITANCRNIIPVVFDLIEGKAIWVDLPAKSQGNRGANNVESNKATIQEKLELSVRSDNKVSLYELFEMHANARGEVVDSVEAAEQIFSLNQGITPYHINEINSEFIK